MKPRIEYAEVAAAGIAALLGLKNYVRQCGFDPALPSAQFVGSLCSKRMQPQKRIGFANG